MYCRFCGKQIQDDSAFCPYCGKALAPQTSFSQPSPQLSSNPSHQSKPKPKSSEVSIGTLSIIASICFYLGIIGFLILYIRMAPGLNDQQIISYFIGATVVIVLAVIVNKIRKQKKTKPRQLIALMFGLLLLIPSVSLRIIYECKIDKVKADIPEKGIVYLWMKSDQEFYSYYKEGQVRDPFSSLILDGKYISGTFPVELNKTYSAEIRSGYKGEVGVASSAASGMKNTTIKFTQSNLKGGYTVKETVSITGGVQADVTIEFTRVCPFWYTIFY